jgi:hypothetical protein
LKVLIAQLDDPNIADYEYVFLENGADDDADLWADEVYWECKDCSHENEC